MYSVRRPCEDQSRMRTLLSIRKAEGFHDRRFWGKGLVQ